VSGLLAEWQGFTRCLADPQTAARMERFLASGGQTPEVERLPITLGDSAWT
jgi:hypothetical protein